MKQWINIDRAYLLVGLVILLTALLITAGAMFSSYAIALGAGLLIDLLIGLGLVGVPNRRIATYLMLVGCFLIITYIVVAAYFDIKGGHPMLVFHRVWLALCLSEILLALGRLRELRQRNGATQWQQ